MASAVGGEQAGSVIVSLTANDDIPDAVIFPDRQLVLSRSRPTIHLGRASHNQAKGCVAEEDNGWFDSPVMSRNHAELVADMDDRTVSIRDIGSTHGTYLNQDGQRLSRGAKHKLEDGDRIRFGNAVSSASGTFLPTTVRVGIQFPGVRESSSGFRVPEYDSGEDESESESDDDSIQEITDLPNPATFVSHAFTSEPIDLRQSEANVLGVIDLTDPVPEPVLKPSPASHATTLVDLPTYLSEGSYEESIQLTEDDEDSDQACDSHIESDVESLDEDPQSNMDLSPELGDQYAEVPSLEPPPLASGEQSLNFSLSASLQNAQRPSKDMSTQCAVTIGDEEDMPTHKSPPAPSSPSPRLHCELHGNEDTSTLSPLLASAERFLNFPPPPPPPSRGLRVVIVDDDVDMTSAFQFQQHKMRALRKRKADDMSELTQAERDWESEQAVSRSAAEISSVSPPPAAFPSVLPPVADSSVLRDEPVPAVEDETAVVDAVTNAVIEAVVDSVAGEATAGATAATVAAVEAAVMEADIVEAPIAAPPVVVAPVVEVAPAETRPAKKLRLRRIAERFGYAALGGATVGAVVFGSLIYSAPSFA